MAIHLQLLPEWYPQEAIILAWPDSYTDWAPWLASVRRSYIDLIRAITQSASGVILLIRKQAICEFKDLAVGLERILLVEADYNDTWVRDYGFLTCRSRAGMQPVEFVFNGWGNKFDAGKDNLVNRHCLASLCRLPVQSHSLVLEGGALEIDDSGHLLSTALCLQNPQRNGTLTLADYAKQFASLLGASKTCFFQHGHLEGDDTDGHIDTLVRFTLDKGLVVQGCHNRPDDPHFCGLQALLDECALKLPEHTLFSLPLPKISNQQGERLPASYANYLINNDQILAPIYQQPEDKQALATLKQAYPAHKILPIDALPLIQQFGSIHCISMQVPKGTLREAVCARFNQGITLYEE